MKLSLGLINSPIGETVDNDGLSANCLADSGRNRRTRIFYDLRPGYRRGTDRSEDSQPLLPKHEKSNGFSAFSGVFTVFDDLVKQIGHVFIAKIESRQLFEVLFSGRPIFEPLGEPTRPIEG